MTKGERAASKAAQGAQPKESARRHPLFPQLQLGREECVKRFECRVLEAGKWMVCGYRFRRRKKRILSGNQNDIGRGAVIFGPILLFNASNSDFNVINCKIGRGHPLDSYYLRSSGLTEKKQEEKCRWDFLLDCDLCVFDAAGSRWADSRRKTGAEAVKCIGFSCSAAACGER